MCLYCGALGQGPWELTIARAIIFVNEQISNPLLQEHTKVF